MTDTLSEEDPWGPGQGSTSLPQPSTLTCSSLIPKGRSSP